MAVGMDPMPAANRTPACRVPRPHGKRATYAHLEAGEEAADAAVREVGEETGLSDLVLHAPILLDCPIHILHGMKDPDVPWEHALTLMDRLSGNPRLTLVKEGDHRLSTPGDLLLIEDALDALVA